MLLRLTRMEEKLDTILASITQSAPPSTLQTMNPSRKRMRVLTSEDEEGDDCDDSTTDAEDDSDGIHPKNSRKRKKTESSTTGMVPSDDENQSVKSTDNKTDTGNNRVCVEPERRSTNPYKGSQATDLSDDDNSLSSFIVNDD
ncbi:hypothetical protein HWV62_4922 [Athelia sp. TMB]|nr:hypothetical protein HWV62_4922 [Athelia sp. TMB]